MCATGLLFAGLDRFWPLLLVAFVGTMNPGSGDVSMFLPLEHALLAACAEGEARTSLFARYSFVGALFASCGALAAALPQWLADTGMAQLDAIRLMFLLYAAAVARRIGLVNTVVFTHIPSSIFLMAAAFAESLPVALGLLKIAYDLALYAAFRRTRR